ncbi:MAG: hypothetical protein Q8Q20_00305, partial [bacterium]|nr:hypothetical protein [bacterium]
GSVAKRLLLNAGVNKPTDDQLFEVIKVLASDNTVAVPELGIDQGKDDEKLPVGFEVDIKRGSERAAEIASNQ